MEENKPQSFDELVQLGLEIRSDMDNVNWRLGDLAIEVTRVFDGQPKQFAAYSKSIGVSVKSFSRCRDVAKVYPLTMREDYSFLSWSHFRRVAALEDKEKWLQMAVENQWSVEKMWVASGGHGKVNMLKAIGPKPVMEYREDLQMWQFREFEDYGKIVPMNLWKKQVETPETLIKKDELDSEEDQS